MRLLVACAKQHAQDRGKDASPVSAAAHCRRAIHSPTGAKRRQGLPTLMAASLEWFARHRHGEDRAVAADSGEGEAEVETDVKSEENKGCEGGERQCEKRGGQRR